MASQSLVALDVGERRIGVAIADTAVKIAVPYDTIEADGTEIEQIAKLVKQESAEIIVVGYPRNQSGDPTTQTQFVLDFVGRLPESIAPYVVYQDESVTSVQAEQQLERRAYSTSCQCCPNRLSFR